MKSAFYSALKIVALSIFVLLIPALFLYEQSTSLIWTILIPVIPVLLLMIGFYNWRNICPLANISKISQNINWFKKRKVPEWFEENFYTLQYSLLFIALSLRLTTLNYHTHYLAYFFITVVLSALLINLFYTGKSWCNFFCPVGAVERIYALSNAKIYDHNSACSRCTACKKNCPDIDLENNYWREGSEKQKTFLFYSFPGLVLGFYLYYYLQSGSFDYYFSGAWAHNDLSLQSGGFFFASSIPIFLAAPLTLGIFTLLSFFLFNFLEYYLEKYKFFKQIDKDTIIHRVKVFASFVAFNIFYIFAGAPAYMHYPLAYGVFYFIVVVSSTVIFSKEIFREEKYFIQEKFALKILKRWKSDEPISNNLKEIYYTYVTENKNKADRRDTYKNTIQDLMQEGVLNENSITILEKLRVQIGISEKEHLDIMKDIKLKHQELFDTSVEKSAEKIYQRNSYSKRIEETLQKYKDLDPSYLKLLQQEYNITDEEHKSIINGLLNSNDKLHNEVLALLDETSRYISIQNSIADDDSRELLFLKYVVNYEFLKTINELFNLLFIIYKDHQETLKSLLNVAKKNEIHDSFVVDQQTLSFMDDAIANKILSLTENFLNPNAPKSLNMNVFLTELIQDQSIEIATAALLALRNQPTEFFYTLNLERFQNNDDKNISKLIEKLLNNSDEITLYERMMYLSGVDIFQNINFYNLYNLAETTNIVHYGANEKIIEEGTVGDTLYILVAGKAQVSTNHKIVSTLGDKDYFGEIALLGDIKRTASITAITEVIALCISKNDFTAFLYENPKVSPMIMKSMIKKLSELKN